MTNKMQLSMCSKYVYMKEYMHHPWLYHGYWPVVQLGVVLDEGGGDAAHVGRQLLPQAEGVVVDECDGRHVGEVVHQEDVVWGSWQH